MEAGSIAGSRGEAGSIVSRREKAGSMACHRWEAESVTDCCREARSVAGHRGEAGSVACHRGEARSVTDDREDDDGGPRARRRRRRRALGKAATTVVAATMTTGLGQGSGGGGGGSGGGGGGLSGEEKRLREEREGYDKNDEKGRESGISHKSDERLSARLSFIRSIGMVPRSSSLARSLDLHRKAESLLPQSIQKESVSPAASGACASRALSPMAKLSCVSLSFRFPSHPLTRFPAVHDWRPASGRARRLAGSSKAMGRLVAAPDEEAAQRRD
uniref:Uncharacterized protein n=1 Tax=Oryza glumipatula TaxID=40148 RepID=A0A0D9Y7U4_9ORYZ